MELILFILVFLIFNRDIASLSVISIFVILIETLFTIYSIDNWQIVFNFNTVIVVIIGMLTMIFAEFISKIISKKNYISSNSSQEIQYIDINKKKLFLVVILDILFTFLYYWEVKKLGGALGYEGAASFGGVKNSYITGTQGAGMNIIIRQSFKFVVASAYIHFFILVNNFFARKEKAKAIYIHMIPIICGCLIIIFSGSRSDILRIFSAGMLYFIILFGEKNQWKKNSSKKFLKISIPLIVLIAVIFSAVKFMVKTEDTTTNNINGVINYVAFYVGSPLEVLNIKIQDGGGDVLKLNNSNISEFVYLDYDSGIGGNVSTIFGRSLIENGLLGMIVYIFLLYFIFGYIYHRKLKYSKSSYQRNKLLIIYSFFYFIFTMSYYSDCFYLTIDVSGLLTLLCIYLIYFFHFKISVGSKGH